MSDNAAGILLERFQFLIDLLAFRIVESETSFSFGNMFVKLTNDVLNVRIYRERDFVGVEVSPRFATDRWIPLGHLCLIMLQRDPIEIATIEEQADFLRCHYPAIATMLSADRLDDTIAQVRQLGKARRSKRFPGSVGDE